MPLLTSPYAVVDDFLPLDLAESMRADIDAHFARPGAHKAETHQVWNYWFVPELYTYLRTSPEKVIQPPSVQAFFDAVKFWSVRHCGMANVTWPYLSLYVAGCRQGLHNDSSGGRFGFVYSLTRNDRRTTGGETVIHHAGDHFRGKLTRASAGRGYYDLVEPRFNRLVVFDDRLPHAVERIEGVMDPAEGRFVLHGHLSETGGIVTGALPAEAVAELLYALVREAMVQGAPLLALHHGVLVLKLSIGPAGAVAACEVIVDRVMHPDAGNADWPRWREELLAQVSTLRFPAAAGVTEVIQPLIFGAPLPKAVG
jgi:hypothetical protein